MTDREKLEAVAASFTGLMELKDKQRVTSALMIRTCLRAITREPTPFEDVARRRQIVKERREALKGLADLADMLDPPQPAALP
jgi:hypothetical protein